MKPTNRTIASPISPSVDGDDHPQSGPWSTPKVNSPIDDTISARPAQSTRWTVASRLSSTDVMTSTMIATQTGTLIHRTHRQLISSVKKPPATGPRASPSAEMPKTTPTARCTSSEENALVTTAIETVNRIAPPTP